MKRPYFIETAFNTIFDESGDPKVSIPLGREILTSLYRRHEPANDWLCQRLAQAMRGIGERHYHRAKAELDSHTIVFFGNDAEFMAAEASVETVREPDPPFDHDDYAPGIAPRDFAPLMPAADKARYQRLWQLYTKRQQWLLSIQDELLDAWFSLSGRTAMSL